MRKELFQPTLESEARLLLLISAFSNGSKSLQGRTKLAKLDFLLRYPQFFKRAISIKAPNASINDLDAPETVESRMVRYRYGPWDPVYFAVLGRLVGKGLIRVVPARNGTGYKTTALGNVVATRLSATTVWADVTVRLRLLRKYFDLSGNSLKTFIYENFPEVTSADWGEKL